MEVSLILIAVLAAAALVLWLAERRYRRRHPSEATYNEPVQECCGMHATCERDSLLAAVSDAPEYFDDEELDRYRGRDATSYTDAETEAFRDVLLTLRADDVAPWARSMQLRGITLPEPVRQELLMMVAEARTSRGDGTA